jgi:bifunctional DNase/RNase
LKGGRASEYVPVKVAEVGFADEHGLEGLIWLKSDSSRSFAMRAFSGETATHMSRFMKGDRSSVPSIFNMIEELAEKQGVHLAGVEVYPSGSVLRSDLQFLGKEKDLLLKGYRASDAIAMALFYDAPILLHSSLLEEREQDPKV